MPLLLLPSAAPPHHSLHYVVGWQRAGGLHAPGEPQRARLNLLGLSGARAAHARRVVVMVGGDGGGRGPGGEIDVPGERGVGSGEEARLVEGTRLLQVVGVGVGGLLLVLVVVLLQLGQCRRAARRPDGACPAEAAESRLGGGRRARGFGGVIP